MSQTKRFRTFVYRKRNFIIFGPSNPILNSRAILMDHPVYLSLDISPLLYLPISLFLPPYPPISSLLSYRSPTSFLSPLSYISPSYLSSLSIPLSILPPFPCLSIWYTPLSPFTLSLLHIPLPHLSHSHHLFLPLFLTFFISLLLCNRDF